MRARALILILLVAIFTPLGLLRAADSASDDAFLGRWDITATGTRSGLPRICWLELRRDGGVLKGRFNAGGGAVFDLPQVMIAGGQLGFQYPAGKPPNQVPQVWQASLQDGRLKGMAIVNGQTLPWTGERGPVWPLTSPARKPGNPIDLFDGKNVSGWLCQDPHHPMGWFVKDGILMNEGKNACNIYSKQKFENFTLHVEFNVDKDSNSGVYLRGRYEIQILDGFSRPMDVHSQGALYGFIVPSAKADKPAGQWQTFDITLVLNHVTVIENGTRIIDHAEVPGLTGGALDANEKDAGPIMLQGDHGRVEFRKVRLTPLI